MLCVKTGKKKLRMKTGNFDRRERERERQFNKLIISLEESGEWAMKKNTIEIIM